MIEIAALIVLIFNAIGTAIVLRRLSGENDGNKSAEATEEAGEKRDLNQEMAERRFSEGVLNVLNYTGPNGRESEK